MLVFVKTNTNLEHFMPLFNNEGYVRTIKCTSLTFTLKNKFRLMGYYKELIERNILNLYVRSSAPAVIIPTFE